MYFTKRIPSSALHALRQSTATTPCLRRAAGRQIRWESTEKTEKSNNGHGKSFSGQLYSSTALRLRREKAERERFSELRNEAGGGKGLAMSFGMFFLRAVWFLGG